MAVLVVDVTEAVFVEDFTETVFAENVTEAVFAEAVSPFLPAHGGVADKEEDWKEMEGGSEGHPAGRGYT